MYVSKRLKSPFEIVSATESDSSVKDEVNRRTWKAGHTDRDGQPMVRRSGAGKGARFRPVDREKFRRNYERAFGHK